MSLNELLELSGDNFIDYETSSNSTNTNSNKLSITSNNPKVTKKKGSRLLQTFKLKKSLAANKKFQKLFGKKFDPGSNNNDRLLVNEFNCALLRNKSLLLQGTLYTTRKYVAFHSNIFGYETYLIKKWTDVIHVKKENIALVFPTAISLTTFDGSFFFASFILRNQAFQVIHKLWNQQFTRIMSNYNSIRRNSCLCFEIINGNEARLAIELNTEPNQNARHSSENSTQQIQGTKSFHQSLDSLINLEKAMINEKSIINLQNSTYGNSIIIENKSIESAACLSHSDSQLIENKTDIELIHEAEVTNVLSTPDIHASSSEPSLDESIDEYTELLNNPPEPLTSLTTISEPYNKDKSKIKQPVNQNIIQYLNVFRLIKHVFNYIMIYLYLKKEVNYSVHQLNETNRVTRMMNATSGQNRVASPFFNNILIMLIISLLCIVLYIYIFLIFLKMNSIETELLIIQNALLNSK